SARPSARSRRLRGPAVSATGRSSSSRSSRRCACAPGSAATPRSDAAAALSAEMIESAGATGPALFLYFCCFSCCFASFLFLWCWTSAPPAAPTAAPFLPPTTAPPAPPTAAPLSLLCFFGAGWACVCEDEVSSASAAPPTVVARNTAARRADEIFLERAMGKPPVAPSNRAHLRGDLQCAALARPLAVRAPPNARCRGQPSAPRGTDRRRRRRRRPRAR